MNRAIVINVFNLSCGLSRDDDDATLLEYLDVFLEFLKSDELPACVPSKLTSMISTWRDRLGNDEGLIDDMKNGRFCVVDFFRHSCVIVFAGDGTFYFIETRATRATQAVSCVMTGFPEGCVSGKRKTSRVADGVLRSTMTLPSARFRVKDNAGADLNDAKEIFKFMRTSASPYPAELRSIREPHMVSNFFVSTMADGSEAVDGESVKVVFEKDTYRSSPFFKGQDIPWRRSERYMTLKYVVRVILKQILDQSCYKTMMAHFCAFVMKRFAADKDCMMQMNAKLFRKASKMRDNTELLKLCVETRQKIDELKLDDSSFILPNLTERIAHVGFKILRPDVEPVENPLNLSQELQESKFFRGKNFLDLSKWINQVPSKEFACTCAMQKIFTAREIDSYESMLEVIEFIEANLPATAYGNSLKALVLLHAALLARELLCKEERLLSGYGLPFQEDVLDVFVLKTKKELDLSEEVLKKLQLLPREKVLFSFQKPSDSLEFALQYKSMGSGRDVLCESFKKELEHMEQNKRDFDDELARRQSLIPILQKALNSAYQEESWAYARDLSSRLFQAQTAPHSVRQAYPQNGDNAFVIHFFLFMPPKIAILSVLCSKVLTLLYESRPNSSIPISWNAHYSQSKCVQKASLVHRQVYQLTSTRKGEANSHFFYNAGVCYPNDMSLTLAVGCRDGFANENGELKLSCFVSQLETPNLQPLMYVSRNDDELKKRENEILCYQHAMPDWLDKGSFLALSRVRSAPNLQLRNSLLMLQDQVECLRHLDVGLCLEQALFQLGPISEDKMAPYQRLWKTDISYRPDFTDIFAYALQDAMSIYRDRVGDHHVIISLIKCAEFLTIYDEVKGCEALRSVAQVSNQWSDEVASESSEMLKARKAIFLAYQVMALSCIPVLSASDASWIVLAHMKFAKYSVLSDLEAITMLKLVVNRVNWAMASVLKKVSRIFDPSNMPHLLTKIYPGVSVENIDNWKMHDAIVKGGDSVEVNISTGVVLVNGFPVQSLPLKIRKDPLYAMAFGEANLSVFKRGAKFLAAEKICGSAVEFFWNKNKELCIVENGKKCLVPHQRIFHDALPPSRFLNDFSHWVFGDTVEFHEKNFFQKGHRPKYLLVQNPDLHHFLEPCDEEGVCIADIDAFSRLTSILVKLVQDKSRIELFVSKQTMMLQKVRLTDSDLEFSCNDGKLCSEEFRDFELSRVQQLQILPNFNKYLLLSPKTVSRPFPEMNLLVGLDQLGHWINVSLNRWGMLDANTPLDLLHLANIYMDNASWHPDRETDFSDLEMVVFYLRRCWSNVPFCALSCELLTQIQKKAKRKRAHFPSAVTIQLLTILLQKEALNGALFTEGTKDDEKPKNIPMTLFQDYTRGKLFLSGFIPLKEEEEVKLFCEMPKIASKTFKASHPHGIWINELLSGPSVGKTSLSKEIFALDFKRPSVSVTGLELECENGNFFEVYRSIMSGEATLAKLRWILLAAYFQEESSSWKGPVSLDCAKVLWYVFVKKSLFLRTVPDGSFGTKGRFLPNFRCYTYNESCKAWRILREKRTSICNDDIIQVDPNLSWSEGSTCSNCDRVVEKAICSSKMFQFLDEVEKAHQKAMSDASSYASSKLHWPQAKLPSFSIKPQLSAVKEIMKKNMSFRTVSSSLYDGWSLLRGVRETISDEVDVQRQLQQLFEKWKQSTSKEEDDEVSSLKRKLLLTMKVEEDSYGIESFPLDCSATPSPIEEFLIEDLKKSWKIFKKASTSNVKEIGQKVEIFLQEHESQVKETYDSLWKLLQDLSVSNTFDYAAQAVHARRKLSKFAAVWCTLDMRERNRKYFGTDVHDLLSSWLEATLWHDKLFRVRECRKEASALMREVESCPKMNDSTEWMLFQVDQFISIRDIQRNVATAMINQSASAQLVQLNMGEGKTKVILPLLCLAFPQKNPNLLTSVNALSTQFPELRMHLWRCLSGIFGKKIYVAPFNRSVKIDSLERINSLANHFTSCMNGKDILLVTPEHRLSLLLKAWEEKLNNSSVWQKLSDLASIPTIQILDESDEILKSSYQLIYTIGQQMPLSECRSRCFAAEIVFKCLRSDVLIEFFKKHEGFVSIELGSEEAFFNSIKVLKMFCPEVDEMNQLLAQEAVKRCFYLDLDLHPRICNFITGNMEDKDLLTTAFKGRSDVVELCLSLKAYLGPEKLLLHALAKRHLVEYGRDKRRTAKHLAVPFKAKDTPSERTEFGHPDLVIVLTLLHFLFHGLSENELQEAFSQLLSCGIGMRESLYNEWLVRSKPLMMDQDLQRLDKVEKIDVIGQRNLLQKYFGHNMDVIAYWVSFFVFPRECVQFPKRLAASAWDLCNSNVLTGFSGTNDNKITMPLAISESWPVIGDNEATNGKMINSLTDTNLGNSKVSLISICGTWKDALDFILENSWKKPVDILIDSGAILVGSSNKDVVRHVLARFPGKFVAGVFFNDDGRLEVLRLSQRDNCMVESTKLRDACSIREEDCFCYLDDAHSRSTDLRLKRDAHGVVTVGKSMPKDKLVQAAMRLRKLGVGQTVEFFVSAEDVKGLEVADSKTLLSWCLKNSAVQQEKCILEWARQGSSFLYKRAVIQSQPEKCCDDEITSLEAMYGIPHVRSSFPQAFASSLEIKFLGLARSIEHTNMLNRINKYAKDIYVYCTSMDEEYERELEQQIEEERQRELPPADNFDAERTMESFQDLKLTALPVSKMFDKTSLESTLENISWIRCDEFYVSENFLRVLSNNSKDHDEYLKDPCFLVEMPGSFVFVSQYEANWVLEKLWKERSVDGIRVISFREIQDKAKYIVTQILKGKSFEKEEDELQLRRIVGFVTTTERVQMSTMVSKEGLLQDTAESPFNSMRIFFGPVIEVIRKIIAMRGTGKDVQRTILDKILLGM